MRLGIYSGMRRLFGVYDCLGETLTSHLATTCDNVDGANIPPVDVIYTTQIVRMRTFL